MRRRSVAIARQEDDAAAVLTRCGQLDARLLAGLQQELVRHLHQHAGAVAGVDLGAAGAAMIEIGEDLQALLQDLVRFAALDVHHEADAAGVVLERRVVKTLLLWARRPATTASVGAVPAHMATRVDINPIPSIEFSWRVSGELSPANRVFFGLG